jgi:RimJ/RimL family protein N-acetyltransferase
MWQAEGRGKKTMARDLFLRDVVDDDLPIFFEHQLDPDANSVAAFTAEDPADREAFEAHWNRILADPTVIARTIVCDGRVVGSVLSYEMDGKPEVSYWIDKPYWGRGIATRALSAFLADVNRARPIYAHVVHDNVASLRVLEKCGFTVIGEARGFANARGAEVKEFILALEATESDT